MKKKRARERTRKPRAVDQGARTSKAAEPDARAWKNPWVPRVLTGIACLYLSSIWLDSVGATVTHKLLPRTFVYFTTVACLFPHAAQAVIDYRAEGWVCSSHSWKEIETAQDFPIDADNKENRFYRAMHFFHGHRAASQALDEYLVSRHNARASHGDRIGGVRLLSLRQPIPEQGKPVPPYARRPLDTYPAEQRKNWFWTRASKRAERCGDPIPPKRRDDETKRRDDETKDRDPEGDGLGPEIK
jgi:hypothetical protein